MKKKNRLAQDTGWELIRQAQQGSAAAMEQICRQYSPLIYTVMRRHRGTWQADARQEAWLALVKAVRMYDPSVGVGFAGYATAVVRGDVRTALRREARVQTRTARLPRPRAADEERPTVLELADPQASAAQARVEWRLLVREAGLSPRELQAVESLVQGSPCSELADIEGVSVETVKTWRKRALRKLRVGLGLTVD